MTLTHECDTPWATSSNNNTDSKNLTDFGKQVVLEMNRLGMALNLYDKKAICSKIYFTGMLVDLSHASDGVMHEAINISKAPVIFSHSSARHLCNNNSNVDDSVLEELVSKF